MSERAARLTFVALGLVQVGVALALMLAPRPVYDAVATFPPRNDHFVRDVGTIYLALGVAFAVAARRPAWRTPVLLVAIVQYAAHTGSHLYDIGRPAESWVGPVNAALVGGGLLVLAVLGWALSRARVTKNGAGTLDGPRRRSSVVRATDS